MYNNLYLMLFKCTEALSSSTHCKALVVMWTYSSGSTHCSVNDLHLCTYTPGTPIYTPCHWVFPLPHTSLPRRWLRLRLPHKSHLTLICRLGFIIFLSQSLLPLSSSEPRVRSTAKSKKPSQLVCLRHQIKGLRPACVNMNYHWAIS